jgi:hypothetical protein
LVWAFHGPALETALVDLPPQARRAQASVGPPSTPYSDPRPSCSQSRHTVYTACRRHCSMAATASRRASASLAQSACVSVTHRSIPSRTVPAAPRLPLPLASRCSLGRLQSNPFFSALFSLATFASKLRPAGHGDEMRRSSATTTTSTSEP